ncbi:MAG: hypothetical protein ACMXYM_03700 [Candidatus Woesearchaeota archaeon]
MRRDVLVYFVSLPAVAFLILIVTGPCSIVPDSGPDSDPIDTCIDEVIQKHGYSWEEAESHVLRAYPGIVRVCPSVHEAYRLRNTCDPLLVRLGPGLVFYTALYLLIIALLGFRSFGRNA